jgi:plasmid maintenance system antidote protein VapI
MEIHVGKLIKNRLQETGMTKSEFARRINKTSQNVYDIFERKTIDTGLLLKISKILDFNFFERYSLTLNSYPSL